MEWWMVFVIIMGLLFLLYSTGMPVAFCFLILNIIGVIVFMGGEAGLNQLILTLRGSVASFIMLPLVFFTLMGEFLVQTGIAMNLIDTLDKWLGRLPGRLALVAVGSGVVLAALSGSSLASTAILGKSLTPEMEKRGYKRPMSLGPVMGAGNLAVLIPPSTIAVLLGALAETSIADVLIGGTVPGLMMAVTYCLYITLRCRLQPSIAPAYEVAPTPLSEKLMLTLKYVVPFGFVIFMVTGIIFLGIATPSEAAATGTVGSIILAACYGRINKKVLIEVFRNSLRISVMILFLITGAIGFGQILGFSGASAGLTEYLLGLPIPPIVIIIVLNIVLVIIGMFTSALAVILVVVPLFKPLITAFGMSPVWFCLLMLVNSEIAAISPPYGLVLFTMKAVAPKGTTMSEIYHAAYPFFIMNLVILGLMIAFPKAMLWLPRLTH
jgi:tripartite ATP-independent transporter DctM subunit